MAVSIGHLLYDIGVWMKTVYILLTALCAYLIGGISFSYLIGKIILRRDIRKYGSKNAGATNMARSFGLFWGLLAFLGDVLKAYAACFLAKLLCTHIDVSLLGMDSVQTGTCIAALFVVLGHNFPVFMRFKGGKGIASSIGVVLFFAWKQFAFIIFPVGLLTMIITKRISIGSILGEFVWALSTLLLYGDRVGYCIVSVFIAMLCIFAHRENIVRIIKGEEKEFTLPKRSLKANEDMGRES